ncbi:MAG: hypothetical protein RR766_06015, partial [Longicatena sp.]
EEIYGYALISEPTVSGKFSEEDETYTFTYELSCDKTELEKEITKLQGEIKRGVGMLSNPNFTQRAPEAKVNAEKEKLEGYKTKLIMNEQRLIEMKKKL